MTGRLSVVFFTDRDLGKQFPDILRAAGLNVERHWTTLPRRRPTKSGFKWLAAEVGAR